MFTDWLLIRRLARELYVRFSGARVRDVGQLEDGRFAIALWIRGHTTLLCVDIFAPTPVLTIEERDLPIAAEPGFVRAAGAAIRGMILAAVRSRTGDRLLRLEFTSRSRFGVEAENAIVCELVPRFGNIVLLKNDTVVAALKEFAASANAVRSVEAGDPYELPPVRHGTLHPLIPPLIAESFKCESADEAGLRPRIEHFVQTFCGAAFPEAPLHVYRAASGELLQAHVVALAQFGEARHERAESILPLLAESRASHAGAHEGDLVAKRRRALERTLAGKERKLGIELAQIETRLRESAARESLRERGDAIYATLHEMPEHERDEAKQRAADFFARYKKAGSATKHLEQRHALAAQGLDDVQALRWDLERSGDAELADVERAIEVLDMRRGPRRSGTVTRKRKPLQYATAAGSRVFVGRSPIENADLTFRIARPQDLWFHVQNQPGAHVILQRDDRAAPPQEDVLAAAGLAAFHSKAKSSPKVTVDYTERKHVRKRPSAAPGLVFYTNPRSVHVEPAQSETLREVTR